MQTSGVLVCRCNPTANNVVRSGGCAVRIGCQAGLPWLCFSAPEVRQIWTVGLVSLITAYYTAVLPRLTLFARALGEEGIADDLRAQLGPTVAIAARSCV